MPKKTAAPNVTGFRVKPRYRDVTCDWFDVEEGEEPFTATIRTNLTWGDVEAMPVPKEATFAEIWDAMAPHVVEWNLVAENIESGQVEPVPPPAEAGPEVFKALENPLSIWLYNEVRFAHLGGPKALIKDAETDRKNG